jgi:hypothetical protein
MSASGPKLFDDDLACDVRELFAELLRRGKPCPEATAALVRDFDEVFGTQEEPVFWLALAAAQWEYGMLQQRLLKRVLRLIEPGVDLERWPDDARLLSQRRKALASLAERLQRPKSKPRHVYRRKRSPPHFPWERGDILAYQLPSGHFLLLRVVAMDRN